MTWLSPHRCLSLWTLLLLCFFSRRLSLRRFLPTCFWILFEATIGRPATPNPDPPSPPLITSLASPRSWLHCLHQPASAFVVFEKKKKNYYNTPAITTTTTSQCPNRYPFSMAASSVYLSSMLLKKVWTTTLMCRWCSYERFFLSIVRRGAGISSVTPWKVRLKVKQSALSFLKKKKWLFIILF